MWHADTRLDDRPDDVAGFVQWLNELNTSSAAGDRAVPFDTDRPVTVARAPGRLDVMGGIADYSGSLVLQLPIREATLAAVQRDPERRVSIFSPAEYDDGRDERFDIALDDLLAMDFDEARRRLTSDPRRQWAAYVAGTVLLLARSANATFDEGVRIVIRSDVPEGKGVSSSAAIEIASMSAVAAAFDVSLDPAELAALGQQTENRIVGAPCGIMDQMTSACGRTHKLMRLLCQPAELQGHIALPDGLAVWGIDSGIRHAVSGSDYGSVRAGAFMGRRIINSLADEPFEHLANVGVDRFERRFAARLPERMTGRAFLDQYGEIDDPVTQVDPGCTYAVRTPTAHPIYEHERVQRFADLLGGQITDAVGRELGQLMLASHASYASCGLGSDGTDTLVEMLIAGDPPETGIYGAKITGGGSGGTVAVLGRADAGERVRDVAARYADASARGGYVFEGSSPGAAAFGHITLTHSS